LYPADANAADVDAVLAALSSRDARLIVTDGDGVEVAHEALLRNWPTLQAWLDEDRDALRTHRRLSDAANAWDGAKSSTRRSRASRRTQQALLYRGPPLAQAKAYARTPGHELNDTEMSFLKASNRNRITAPLKSFGSAFLLLMITAIGFSLLVTGVFPDDSPDELMTESEYLGSTSGGAWLLYGQLAGPLEIERADGTVETYEIAATPPESAQFSPDSKWIATAGPDGVVVWNLSSRKREVVTDEGNWISVTFAPDSNSIITEDADGNTREWPFDTGES
jgi:hypothetical protein